MNESRKRMIEAVNFALLREFIPGMRVRITNARKTFLNPNLHFYGTLIGPTTDHGAPAWNLTIDGSVGFFGEGLNLWCLEDCMEPIWEDEE